MAVNTEDQRRTSLRHLRGFRLLMAGETVSELGNAIGSFALPLAVLIVTGSALKAGVITASAIAGSILTSMVAGAWADSHSRRQVMLWTLAIRTLTWTSMGICLLTQGVILAVFAPLAFAGGATTALFESAQAGAIKKLVPRALYPRAVAVIDGRNAAADIVGAPTGGFLVAFGASVPVLVNACSFVASLTAIASIHSDLGSPSLASGQKFFHRVREGYRYVWQRVPYRMLIVQSTLTNFACNAFTFALILILQQANAKPWTIGLIPTGTAVTALLGAFLVNPIIDRLTVSTTIIAADTLRLTTLVSITIWHDNAFVCMILAALGFILTPAANAAERTYMALTTPDHLQGRVQSFDQFVGSALVPLAPLGAGLLVSTIATTAALGVFTAIACVALIGILASQSIRSLPRVSTLEEL